MSGLRRLPQPKSVGMLLYGLITAEQHTPSLFSSTASAPSSAQSPRPALLSTIDHINLSYGKNALYFAAAHQALDHASMRIAFNRIPDLETEA
jgi:DNA polymerase IV